MEIRHKKNVSIFSPIKDLCTDEIVSYSISKHPTTAFVVKPLDALIKLRPKLNYRMTLHSDQGVQYQSVQWRKKLKENRIFQSMSRRATCLDNAPMESFFPHNESRAISQ